MKTLILIDPNKDDLQFMKEAIFSVDPDIQCLSFVYAEEAMRALVNDLVIKPAAIFINLNMPRKNGLQCILELRTIQNYNDVPIFLYSPTIASGIREVLRDSGATMAFEKPNTIKGWKSVMNEMLNSVPDSQFENVLESSPSN